MYSKVLLRIISEITVPMFKLPCQDTMGFSPERTSYKLTNEIEKISGPQNVSFNDLFPPSFMIKHTKYASIDEMVTKSQFKVENEEDFRNIPDEAWDVYVRENTPFKTWAEMMSKAGEEYVGKKVQKAIGTL
jgi:hypothetical protein